MHLLLLLDLRDKLVPIESAGENVRTLPLYYPLRYGMGGGEVQYDIVSDTRIRILSSLHEEDADDPEGFWFPDEFPTIPVTIVPLTYAQNRAIAASEHGSNHFSADPEAKADLQILRDLGYWSMIRLGDNFSPSQGGIRWPCRNRTCKWRSKEVRVDVFASFTSTLTDEISIWGDHGDDAEIYFGLTSCCRTIVAVNRCT